MKDGQWKWLVAATIFAVLIYGGQALPGLWPWAALGAVFVLFALVWLAQRAGKMPDDSEARAEYERAMQRRPGESWWRAWLRRLFWQL